MLLTKIPWIQSSFMAFETRFTKNSAVVEGADGGFQVAWCFGVSLQKET